MRMEGNLKARKWLRTLQTYVHYRWVNEINAGNLTDLVSIQRIRSLISSRGAIPTNLATDPQKGKVTYCYLAQ